MNLALCVLLAIFSVTVGHNCSEICNATYYNEGFNSTGTVSLKIPLPVIEDENTTLNASILFPDSPAENQQNFTYYYIFMQRNFRDDNWTTFACVQGNNSVSVVSRWSSDVGDMAQCLVELYSPDCSLIDNDTTTVTIAGNLSGFSVDLRVHQEGDKQWLSYVVGEVNFSAHVMSLPGDLVEYRYLFGDGNKNHSNHSRTTHTYDGVCLYCIAEIYVIVKEGLYYYYAKDTQIISVIEPVTVNNSNTTINNGKKLYKEYAATLRLFSNGTLPIKACWRLCDINNINCTLSVNSSNGTSCVELVQSHVREVSLSFSKQGRFLLNVSYVNNASQIKSSYNLTVGSFPVGAIAGGVIAAIVIIVIIAILVTSILGYIQYQRYKNKHIETASFNFSILPPIYNNSVWARFKWTCHRTWYKLTGRRYKEGLVTKLSGTGEFTDTRSFTSSGVSYGTLLVNENTKANKNVQASALQDYVSGQFVEDEDNGF